MIEYFLNAQSIEALGWTLLHSLWQGAAFAIFLVLILIALRSYSAQARYIVSVGVLSVFFLTLSTTFWLQWQQANTSLELADSFANQKTTDDAIILNPPRAEELRSDSEIINTIPSNNEAIDDSAAGWLTSFRDYYQRHLPLLVTIWLLGVLVLQLRFLGQLAYVQRLKHYGTQLFPTSWNEKIEELEGKLRIQKKVQYLTSIRIESPMVIGWLKPVVLMPQQVFSSLSETEIYAVLAHELAHIRREDFIVNLLQTFLCNVFFFHPGVWWMSNRIDDEREHCCDDLAVAVTGPATSYAKTLINVSELQLRIQRNPQLAMALSGKKKKRERGGFTDRIRRLFMVNNGAGTFKEGFATAVIVITALFVGVAATGSTLQDADSKDPAEITETENTSENEILNDLDLNLDTKIINTTAEENNPTSPISKVDISKLPVAPSPQSAAPLKSNQPRIDALIMACKEGDLDFVKTLIKSGIEINGVGTNRFTPLMMATSHREHEIVAYLIKQGADVNQSHNGWTALIEAADEGSLTSMKHLLKAGADVNYFQAPECPTAISMAASEGKLDCLKLLLKNGADINGIGKSIPPLHNAAKEGKRDIIDYLISEKVNINKTDALGRTALMFATHEGHKHSIIKLIESGVDISIVDHNGETVRDYVEIEDKHDIRKYLAAEKRPEIHQAIINGQIEKVQRMVEQGADINTIDNDGRTPLHIVAARNHIIHMRVLINLGADINAQDNTGRTPLMYAAAEGEGDAVALLVSHQANINVKDVDGKRAFDWAMFGRHSELANFLGLITEKKLRTDNNISHRTNSARSEVALDENKESYKGEQNVLREDQVIRKDEQQILKSIEKQTQKEVDKAVQKDVNKREAFHVAANGTHLRQFNLNTITPALVEVARNGSLADLQQLLHNELDINAADATGQTALMAAVSRNRLDIAKVLIQNMADVNQSSSSGLTALHYAALEDYDEMAQLLLNNNAFVDVTMQYSVTDERFKKEAFVWEYIGATPLLVAVEAGNAKVAAVLIKAGADIHQSLTRNEFKLIKNRFSYTRGGEVIIDNEFLKNVASQTGDDTWTPYKHALHINKPAIRSLFK